MIKILGFGEITNHNAMGLCAEKNCPEREYVYYEIQIGKIVYLLALCDKHCEQVYQDTKYLLEGNK